MECQRYIWNWTLEMLCPDPVVELSPVLGSGSFESGQQGVLLFRAGGFGSLTEVAWGHSGVPGIWHAHSSAHTLPTKWLSRLNYCFDHSKGPCTAVLVFHLWRSLWIINEWYLEGGSWIHECQSQILRVDHGILTGWIHYYDCWTMVSGLFARMESSNNNCVFTLTQKYFPYVTLSFVSHLPM